MRIGVIVSSQGSAFKKVYEIAKKYLNIEWHVVTDRECGLENFMENNKISYKYIKEKDNKLFSIKAKEHFSRIKELEIIFLFFTRFVTKELFEEFYCFNIHPSLLPAFPGSKAEIETKKRGVKFVGATLHLVDEGCDTGKILAQVCMPVACLEKENIGKYGYIQKIYLSLLLLDLYDTKMILLDKVEGFYLNEGLSYTDRCNPCLSNSKFLEELKLYQEYLKIYVV